MFFRSLSECTRHQRRWRAIRSSDHQQQQMGNFLRTSISCGRQIRSSRSNSNRKRRRSDQLPNAPVVGRSPFPYFFVLYVATSRRESVPFGDVSVAARNPISQHAQKDYPKKRIGFGLAPPRATAEFELSRKAACIIQENRESKA